MHYAVILSGGKQYKVSLGDIIEVDRLALADGADASFDKVLLYRSENDTKIGNPVVSGITVMGKVLGNIRGEKIRVSSFKAKVRHRRTMGFRAALSKIQITKIGDKVFEEPKETKKVAEEKPKRTRKAASK